jgi:hypothetical protein
MREFHYNDESLNVRPDNSRGKKGERTEMVRILSIALLSKFAHRQRNAFEISLTALRSILSQSLSSNAQRRNRSTDKEDPCEERFGGVDFLPLRVVDAVVFIYILTSIEKG